MNLLRRISTPKLIALVVLPVAAVLATAVALAAGRSGPKPPPRSLASALNAALHAKPVSGFSARITFTNHLFPDGALTGSPLLAGASGRVWISNDGRFRLELQSDTGDTQITGDGSTITVYDAAKGALYRLALPAGKAGAASGKNSAAKPSRSFGISQIQHAISRLSSMANVSGAVPGDIAGRPVYLVRVSPSHDGGLLGAVQLAWDAEHGVPLKLAVYSRGDSSPVLALTATDVHYGSISSSALSVHAPDSIKPVDVKLPSASPLKGHDAKRSHISGTANVARALSFKLSAPSSLVGLPQRAVRLIETGDSRTAVVLYGQGLGTLAVFEQPADTSASARDPLAGLPAISINGARGHELATALGTAIRVTSGGVTYTLVGSVPAVAAEAAARAVS
jgi:outer membrane lipoprotein-sorting protein